MRTQSGLVTHTEPPVVSASSVPQQCWARLRRFTDGGGTRLRRLARAAAALCGALLWLPLLPAPPLRAAALPQSAPFTRAVWRVRDGLPENTVQAIQQSASGYLWIGTTGGAVRFDGGRFQPAPSAERSIFAIRAARDGTVWLGTEGSGLVRIRDGTAKVISTAEGLTEGFVRAILEDHGGRIWVGTDNGLFWIDGDRAHAVDAPDFGTQFSVHGLMEDAAGHIWVGGSKLLVFPQPADPRHIAGVRSFTLPGAFSENRIKCLLEDREHTVWIGTVGGLDRLVGGLDRLPVGSFERVPGVTGTVRTMLETADGSLWIGTIGHGLYRKRPQTDTVSPVAAPAGQGSINTVLALFEDDSRQLWIGGQDGLFRLRSTPVRVVPLPGDTAPDFATISNDRGNGLWMVSSRVFHLEDGIAVAASLPSGLRRVPMRNILRARDGSLWFGTDGSGVYHQTDRGLVHFLAPQRLVNNFVRAFLEASDGTLWVGTDEGVSRIRGERVDNLRMADGLAYFSTRCLMQDRSGDIWIGTERGLSHWSRGHFVDDAVTAALAQEKVWSMLEARDGTLWFGTRDHGLFAQTASGLRHFTTQQGLASDSIYQVLEGQHGRLWMSGPTGISSFALTVEPPGSRSYLATTVYDLPEGSSGTELYGGRQPAGVLDARGAVWFPSTRGAVEITDDDRGGRAAQQAPRVEITGILANGQSLNPTTTTLDLPPSLTRLEISFAPLLIRPQTGLRFRYRLEGFDETWIDPGSSRIAAYTSLPAGHYRFRVEVFDAAEPDRVSEAGLALSVRRHFYNTLWFVGLCVLLCLLLAWAIYAGRLRQIRLRFAAVIDERNRLAREMHDTVIQGCTGISALLEAMASLDSRNQPLRADLLEHARTQIRSTIDEAREAVWHLRHDDAEPCTDLPARFERLASQVQADLTTRVVCVSDGPNLPIGDSAARELLMVVREAVYNAALHGAPGQVTVCLQSSAQCIVIEVRDDGRGFDPRTPPAGTELHYGIAGMRERIERMEGEFSLHSTPGSGTVVRATVRREHLLPARPEKILP